MRRRLFYCVSLGMTPSPSGHNLGLPAQLHSLRSITFLAGLSVAASCFELHEVRGQTTSNLNSSGSISGRAYYGAPPQTRTAIAKTTLVMPATPYSDGFDAEPAPWQSKRKAVPPRLIHQQSEPSPVTPKLQPSNQTYEPERIQPQLQSAPALAAPPPEPAFTPAPSVAPAPAVNNAVQTPLQSNNGFNRGLTQNYLPSLKPIGQIDINIAAKPKEQDNSVPPLATMQPVPQIVGDYTASWMDSPDLVFSRNISATIYQPLYFEEVNLERYGRAYTGQPALSIARFFGTIPMMPYAMTVRRPDQPLVWRWPYEPGWGAPRVRELPPFSWKAATVEALALTGAAAVIP